MADHRDEDYSDANPKWKGCQQCDGPNPKDSKGNYIVTPNKEKK
jgi:hypothetical protein